MQLRLNHAATHVNADNHTLDVRDPDGGTLVIGYEQLVIGTGAVPARPPIAGLDLVGVHVLHTMDHVLAVHADMTAASATRVLVVGAGYIGLELVDASTHRSLDVTVVEMLDHVLPTVDAELADLRPRRGTPSSRPPRPGRRRSAGRCSQEPTLHLACASTIESTNIEQYSPLLVCVSAAELHDPPTTWR